MYAGVRISELQKQFHAQALEKGWWDDRLDESPVTKLALVHSEVTEAIEEYRSGHPMSEIYYVDGKPEGVPIELGDILIRVFDLAQRYGISLEEALEIKAEYNETRSHRHGGKRF